MLTQSVKAHLCKYKAILFMFFTEQWNGKGVNAALLCLFFLVWIIYEQVMIAALDCSRDDLALVSTVFPHTPSAT